jgi:nitroreductase
MTRAFTEQPVSDETVASLVDLARRAPSAGNTQGWDLVVLIGNETSAFWDITLPAERRERFRWTSLLTAPVIALPYANRNAYLARYGEPDKAATGLSDADRWPVPYWQIDTAFFTQTFLLAAEAAGLGALFFGVFKESAALGTSLGVPDGHDLIGAIALGHRAPDTPGRSVTRPKRTVDDIVHRGRWQRSEGEPLGEHDHQQ